MVLASASALAPVMGREHSHEKEMLMRKLVLATSVVMTVLSAGSALAEEDANCGNAPRDQWIGREAITTKVTAMGYQVKRVKPDDGCYEVRAIDKQGAKAELYLNPVTGEVVRNKMDD